MDTHHWIEMPLCHKANKENFSICNYCGSGIFHHRQVDCLQMHPFILVEIERFYDYLWIVHHRCGQTSTEYIRGRESMQTNVIATFRPSNTLFIYDELNAVIFVVEWRNCFTKELKLSWILTGEWGMLFWKWNLPWTWNASIESAWV